MAGIGFELKKLFKQQGILRLLRAYGYTGLVTAGPMLLGVFFLMGIGFIGQFFGLDAHQRELLNAMITYALLGSLVLTGYVSLTLSRYISDMLYTKQEKRVMPSLKGVLALLLPLSALLYGSFLLAAGISIGECILNFLFFMELVVVWTEMHYMTAIKDYKGILFSYLLAILLSFLVAALGCRLFGVRLEVLLLSVILGYGVMMILNYLLLNAFFPRGSGYYFDFLDWMEQYRWLGLTGFMLNIGLFSHLVIAWCRADIGEQIQGLFYGAPQHDVAALYAFMTILVTTINFVASVEVNFYPKYRAFYDLFNGRGSITEIRLAEQEMMYVMERELSYTAKRQLYTTAIALSLGTLVLHALPLGFDALMDGYFRILCVGYGLYAVGNVLMLMLLYFTDYKGAGIASISYAVVTTLGSLLALRLPGRYVGFAFAIGGMVYFCVSWYRLNAYTRRLSYHILSTQPFVVVRKHGFFTWLHERLEVLCEIS